MFRNLPQYADTKPCEFWSSPIPVGWREVPGFAVLRGNRRTKSELTETQVLSLSYGRIVVKSVEMQHGLVPESYEGYQTLEPGDIVIRPTDLQNDQQSIRVGVARDHGIITSAYIGLHAQGGWESAYAYLYMSVVDSSKRIYGMGSGLRQQLSWADIKRMPCLVPPAAEQAAIVKYLSHANARIDKAITAKRRLIVLMQEKRAVEQREVFAELGSATQRAKDVCLRIIDCKNRTPDYVEDGKFLVARTTCVRNGAFDPEGGYPTDLANFTSWTQRGVPRRGDVLFTREAPAGEASLVPSGVDLCLGQRMMLYRPDPTRALSEYLLHALYDEPAREFIALATNGSTVGHLRVGDVGSIPIRVATIAQQQTIVLKLRDLVHQARETVERLEQEIALLQEFRTRLVADVVTGQVDIRAIAATLSDAPEVTVESLEEDVALLNEELDDTVGDDDE